VVRVNKGDKMQDPYGCPLRMIDGISSLRCEAAIVYDIFWHRNGEMEFLRREGVSREKAITLGETLGRLKEDKGVIIDGVLKLHYIAVDEWLPPGVKRSVMDVFLNYSIQSFDIYLPPQPVRVRNSMELLRILRKRDPKKS
jgi:hypothetical protein